MPMSLFSLIMTWVLIFTVILAAITISVGLKRKERKSTALYFAVALPMPLAAWTVLMVGS